MFKKSLLCLLGSTLFFANPVFVQDTNYTEVSNLSHLKLLNPDLKERQVAKMRLENGLSVLIISDPNSRKSGAALCAQVGLWHDPEDYPGLTHLLEHALFLVSSRYPIEYDYADFLSKHHGVHNAWTSLDRSVFGFSVDTDAFEEALDRFASFFAQPEFSHEGIQKEMGFVDQEYKQSQSDPWWSVELVQQRISNPKHPFSRYFPGNIKSLEGISTQDLSYFYHTNYSAHKMHLAIESSLDLDSLKEKVVKYFSTIKHVNVSDRITKEKIFDPKTLGMRIDVYPKEEIEEHLLLAWELPKAYAKKAPLITKVFKKLLEGRYQGSLLSELSYEGLVENIEVLGTKMNQEHFVFNLNFSLTKEGVKQRDLVLLRLFQAIETYKKMGIPSYMLEQMGQMERLDYEWQKREGVFYNVMHTASALVDESLSSYPDHSVLVSQKDSTFFDGFLQHLQADEAQIFFISHDKPIDTLDYEREEKMHAQYRIYPVAPHTLAKWKQALSSVAIAPPPPNLLVPDSLEIVPQSMKGESFAELLLDNDFGKMYYLPDKDFYQPKIYWDFIIKTPLIQRGNAKDAVLADLYVHNLQKALQPPINMAKEAGLDLEIHRADDGIRFTLSGYSQKAEGFLDQVMHSLHSFYLSREIFEFDQAQLFNQYRSISLMHPLEQSRQVLHDVVFKYFISQEDKARVVHKITYDDFLSFMEKLYKETYMEGVLGGNISYEAAIALANKITSSVSSKPFFRGRHLDQQVIVLDQEKGPFFLTKHIQHQNHAAMLMIEHGQSSHTKRVALELLAHLSQGHFHHNFRTENKMAYLSDNWPQEVQKQLMSFFAVESRTYHSRDLLDQFEVFLEGFLRDLQGHLTIQQFAEAKACLVGELEKPYTNIEVMGRHIAEALYKGEEDFTLRFKLARELKTLSLDNFLHLAREFYSKENRRRLAILVDGMLPKHQEGYYKRAANAESFRSENRFFLPKEKI